MSFATGNKNVPLVITLYTSLCSSVIVRDQEHSEVCSIRVFSEGVKILTPLSKKLTRSLVACLYNVYVYNILE